MAIEALENWETNYAKASEVLAARPKIGFSLVWIWNAFWELCQCRSVGMASERIKHSEILAYGAIHQLDAADRWELYRCVVLLDEIWINWARKKKPDGS